MFLHSHTTSTTLCLCLPGSCLSLSVRPFFQFTALNACIQQWNVYFNEQCSRDVYICDTLNIKDFPRFYCWYFWCLDMFPYWNVNKREELYHWYLTAISTVHKANIYQTQFFSIIIGKGKKLTFCRKQMSACPKMFCYSIEWNLIFLRLPNIFYFYFHVIPLIRLNVELFFVKHKNIPFHRGWDFRLFFEGWLTFNDLNLHTVSRLYQTY